MAITVPNVDGKTKTDWFNNLNECIEASYPEVKVGHLVSSKLQDVGIINQYFMLYFPQYDGGKTLGLDEFPIRLQYENGKLLAA